MAPAPQTRNLIDVFISYAREDRPKVESLANALGSHGWTVWWDSRISGGQSWRKEIQEALRKANCVVVLWSRASVESPWVLTEAEEGRKREILIPAMLEDVEIPFGFGEIHALNLVNWREAEPHQGFDELVRDIAHILDLPPPSPPPPQKRWNEWLMRGGSLVPILIGSALYFMPVTETVIELDAKLSEFSFVSSQQQELSDLLVLSSLGVSGLKEVHLPRALSSSAEALRRDDGNVQPLRLIPNHTAQKQGAISLAPLSLHRGTQVTVRMGTDPYQSRISLRGSTFPVRVSVQDSLQLLVAGSPAQSIDFGPPKPLILQPDPNGVNLEITPERPQQNLLPAPLSISGLALLRIDERVEAQRTVVREVSTILSGMVRFESLGGEERSLPSGEMIQFENSRGEIRTLQVNEDHLTIEFQGQVQGMKTCVGKTCKSLMPTALEWLWAQQRLPLIAAATAYIFMLVMGGMRWWKRHA
jgi:hypothetical protein